MNIETLDPLVDRVHEAQEAQDKARAALAAANAEFEQRRAEFKKAAWLRNAVDTLANADIKGTPLECLVSEIQEGLWNDDLPEAFDEMINSLRTPLGANCVGDGDVADTLPVMDNLLEALEDGQLD